MSKFDSSTNEKSSESFSWAGEEVWVRELLSRLASPTRYVVDIGASDGVTGSNTNFLYKLGYDGLVVEGQREKLSQALLHYKNYTGNISFLGTFVDSSNIVDLFDCLGVPTTPDFISVDIDSVDLELTEAILKKYKPSVICVEINERLPPPILYELRSENIKTTQRDLTMISSASVCSWFEMLSGFGFNLYRLELNNLICYNSALPDFSHLKPRSAEEVYGDFSQRADRDQLLPHNFFFFRPLLESQKHSSFVELSVNDIKDFYEKLFASLNSKGVFYSIPSIAFKVRNNLIK